MATKRDYKHEYDLQQKRGELPLRMERQKARRELDAKGVDRTGKQIDHIVPLSLGGSNAASNRRLVSPSANMSYPRTSSGKPKASRKK